MQCTLSLPLYCDDDVRSPPQLFITLCFTFFWCLQQSHFFSSLAVCSSFLVPLLCPVVVVVSSFFAFFQLWLQSKF
jgi:hypothetical protein